MEIKIDFNQNELPKKYSKYAEEKEKYNENPIVSFPFEIINVPQNTKYFCITLIDHDAIPVCGFSWIHWTVANIDASLTAIPENYSQNDKFMKIQGKNSFASALAKETDTKVIHRYVGPTPPDSDHQYTLTVYALSEPVNLKEGFYLNELYKEMQTRKIAVTSLNIIGKK